MKEIEVYNCPHCNTKGVLPMDDMRCPNCKQKMGQEHRQDPTVSNTKLQDIDHPIARLPQPTTDSISGHQSIVRDRQGSHPRRRASLVVLVAVLTIGALAVIAVSRYFGLEQSRLVPGQEKSEQFGASPDREYQNISDGIFEFKIPLTWDRMSNQYLDSSLKTQYEEQAKNLYEQFHGNSEGYQTGLVSIIAFWSPPPERDVSFVALVMNIPSQGKDYLSEIYDRSNEALKWGIDQGTIKKMYINKMVSINDMQAVLTDCEMSGGERIVGYSFYFPNHSDKAVQILATFEAGTYEKYREEVETMFNSIKISYAENPLSPKKMPASKKTSYERTNKKGFDDVIAVESKGDFDMYRNYAKQSHIQKFLNGDFKDLINKYEVNTPQKEMSAQNNVVLVPLALCITYYLTGDKHYYGYADILNGESFDNEKAMLWSKAFLAEMPESPVGQFIAGVVKELAKQYVEAIPIYEKLLASNWKSSLVENSLSSARSALQPDLYKPPWFDVQLYGPVGVYNGVMSAMNSRPIKGKTTIKGYYKAELDNYKTSCIINDWAYLLDDSGNEVGWGAYLTEGKIIYTTKDLGEIVFVKKKYHVDEAYELQIFDVLGRYMLVVISPDKHQRFLFPISYQMRNK